MACHCAGDRGIFAKRNSLTMARRSTSAIPPSGATFTGSNTSLFARCEVPICSMLSFPSPSRSLSGILCVRHSMTTRSIYAKQDEGREGGHGP